MTDLLPDLNDTIVSAVQARVSAEVLKALSGDELIGQMVAAALNKPVTVRRGYRDEQSTWVAEAVREVVTQIAREALHEAVELERPAIKKAVTDHLRGQRETIAENLVGGLAETSNSPYRVDVNFAWPKPE